VEEEIFWGEGVTLREMNLFRIQIRFIEEKRTRVRRRRKKKFEVSATTTIYGCL
jgi:hypothetical protein